MKITSIKLFISSTFLDMQEERNYLMSVIVPKLTLRCNERGLNFYCYDLRWGITDDQAAHNGTIIPCLKAVDDAKPFFVGIIGERYGWIPSKSECEALNQFQLDASDVSITELEMLYGALNIQNQGFCSFYFRDKAVSGSFVETNPDRIRKLDNLKQRIRNSGYPCLDGYMTAKEFGDRLFVDFVSWLDQNFSENGDVEYNKQISYMTKQSEIQLSNPQLRGNIPLWLAKGYPLFIAEHNTALNAMLQTDDYFLSNPDFDAIHVHLRASNNIRYAECIILYILKQINVLYPGSVEEKYLNCSFTSSKSEKERWELFSYFREFCKEITPKKPIYIFLTDAQLLNREIDMTFYYFFNVFNQKINILITAEDCPHHALMEMLGWNIRQITMADGLCEMLMMQKLMHSGKALSEQHKNILRNKIELFRSFDDMELITELLMTQIIHEKLEKTISFISENSWKPIPVILESLISDRLDQTERKLLNYSYWILSELDFSISEGDLQSILHVLVEFTSAEWTNFIMFTKPLLPIIHGYISITNSAVRNHMLNRRSEMSQKEHADLMETMLVFYQNKIDLMPDSHKTWSYYENLNVIRKYISLCLNLNKYEPLSLLFSKNKTLLAVMAKYDMSLVRKIMYFVPSEIQQYFLKLFDRYNSDIYAIMQEIGESEDSSALFLQLFANLKTFDQQGILKDYVNLNKYTLAKRCSSTFLQSYMTLEQALLQINSQQALDDWYKMATVYLSPYLNTPSNDKVYAFKLLSMYATTYASNDFAIKMSIHYLQASAENNNEYEFTISLLMLEKAYRKYSHPEYTQVANNIHKTANMLRKKLGYL